MQRRAQLDAPPDDLVFFQRNHRRYHLDFCFRARPSADQFLKHTVIFRPAIRIARTVFGHCADVNRARPNGFRPAHRNSKKVRVAKRHVRHWNRAAEWARCTQSILRNGHILVREGGTPDGAKIEPVTIFDETCGASDSLYYGKGPQVAVADSDFRRRFTETAVGLHAELYVMGQAHERQDVVAPEIAQDPTAPMFLISTRTEQQISSGFRWGFWGLGFLGLILCVAGFFAEHKMADDAPAATITTYVLAATGYLFASGLGWVWMVYNGLIDLRQRVRQGWSQVDVQLKRRHDLIPNLVGTVKGLRDFEQNLQTELAGLRSQLEATPPGVEGPDYRACGTILVAIQERYPELKAQESFANLQKNLIDTEQRIALARGYFNEIATFYNTRLEVVPDRFIAALGGLKPQPLMAANDFERAPVEVNNGTITAGR